MWPGNWASWLIGWLFPFWLEGCISLLIGWLFPVRPERCVSYPVGWAFPLRHECSIVCWSHGWATHGRKWIILRDNLFNVQSLARWSMYVDLLQSVFSKKTLMVFVAMACSSSYPRNTWHRIFGWDLWLILDILSICNFKISIETHIMTMHDSHLQIVKLCYQSHSIIKLS